MKKIMVTFLSVVLLLSSLSVFVWAKEYENEYISFDVPSIFSSKTEDELNGMDYVQWTCVETRSNINLTVDDNTNKECYADLSDVQLQAVKASFVAEIEREVKNTLEMYSADFEILKSEIKPFEVGETKGTRLDLEIRYIYADGSDFVANQSACIFSTEEKIISVGSTTQTKKEMAAAEDLFNSIVIKGGVYTTDSAETGIIGFVIFGAMVGALIGIILVLRKKKKKQKMVQSGYNGAPNQPGYNGVPNQPGYNGVPNQPSYNGAPNQSGYNGAPNQAGYNGVPNQPGYNGVPNQPGYNGTPNQPGYNGAPNQFNNNDFSPDHMNPNN